MPSAWLNRPAAAGSVERFSGALGAETWGACATPMGQPSPHIAPKPIEVRGIIIGASCGDLRSRRRRPPANFAPAAKFDRGSNRTQRLTGIPGAKLRVTLIRVGSVRRAADPFDLTLAGSLFGRPLKAQAG